MKLQDLIDKCLKKSTYVKRITGSRILKHVESPYFTYCDLFAPKTEKDPESDYIDILGQKGIEHEYSIVQNLLPDVKISSIDDKVQAFKFLIREMEKGTKYFTGFPLIYEPKGFSGYIDVLIRENSHNSVFGDHHYMIGEVKLAKNIKDKHILQAMFYNKLLGLIQGYEPKTVILINGEGKWIEYKYEAYKTELEKLINEIISIQRKELIPLPENKTCPSPWNSYSNKRAWESKDLTCIPGVGPSKRDLLLTFGKSIYDIANLDEGEISSVKGFGKRSARKIKLFAQSISLDQNIKLADPEFVNTKYELYIDFEGVDPTTSPIKWTSFDFLFGLIIYNTQTNEQEFKTPLIRDPFDDDEVKLVVEEFLDILAQYPKSPIYHWHSYEKTSLKKLTEKYDLQEKVNPVIPRLVDLYKVVNDSWVFPISSLSIKKVAPYLGFTWRKEEMEGRKAIATYIEYMLKKQKNDSFLKDVIDYNEDDIKAMIFIKEWLKDN